MNRIPKFFQGMLFFMITFIFFGCITTQTKYGFLTQSGEPEVTITSNNLEKIKASIINEFINSRFSLISETDHGIEFSKKWDDHDGEMYSMMYIIFNGSQYQDDPILNTKISFLQINDHIRIVAQTFIKMQNIFGKINQANNKNQKVGDIIMNILMKVKMDIESQPQIVNTQESQEEKISNYGKGYDMFGHKINPQELNSKR